MYFCRRHLGRSGRRGICGRYARQHSRIKPLSRIALKDFADEARVFGPLKGKKKEAVEQPLFSKISIHKLLSCFFDPFCNSANFAVNAVEFWTSATFTPADNTDQSCFASSVFHDQRTTAVALASVFATFCLASAKHAISNVIETLVNFCASCLVNQRNIYFLQFQRS